MRLGSHKSGFTAGQLHFVLSIRRSAFVARPNLSSRPASASLSRLADNISDPILRRALKVHAVTLLVAAGHPAHKVFSRWPCDSFTSLMHFLPA